MNITLADWIGQMKSRDLKGVVIGRMRVVDLYGSDNGAVWNCLCDCGKEFRRRAGAISTALREGRDASCGCKNIGPRDIAIQKGYKKYKTDEPCAYGHHAERLVSSRGCVECARLKDIETRPSRMEYFKEYQNKNKDKSLAAQKKYRDKNRELRREKDRIRRQDPETKKKRAMYQRLRYQRSRKSGDYINPSDIENIINLQAGRCANCQVKVDKYHIDHIMPLSKGGENILLNIQVLCPECNLKKASKLPCEWAIENGRLL